MTTFRWLGHPNDKLFSKDMAEYMAMCIALTTNCTGVTVPWPEDHPDAEDFKGVYLVHVYESIKDDGPIVQLSNSSAVREWIRTRIWYEQQQQLDNSKRS